MFDLVILGAGESGTGAALLAKAKGMSVFVSDKGSIAPNYRKELEAADILFEENGHTDELILNASEVIKSPGIPDSNLLVGKIKAKGIPVMDELEFATRFTRAKFIGITGSNGKTTTTLLAYHLMQGCGFSVGLAGNVGKSLARQVITDQFDWYVVEISSFQLDGMHGFQSDIAILTNITPDHLDRYDYKFENYIQSKFRIIKNLTPAQFFITSGEDPMVLEELNKYAAMPNMIQAGLSEEKSTKLFFDGSNLNFKIGTLGELQIPASILPISGTHNLMNSMMAVTAVLLAGGTPDKILAGLETFQNAPHRCEAITTIAGVQFVNDSKATNVDSVKYAFSAYQKPIVWIAGGVDKGNDYAELDEPVSEKVKAIICLGRENAKLKSHFGKMVPVILETTSVSELVELAMNQAEKGDTVLLSPACASFDLFRNYEDRGNQFKAAVLEMEKKMSNQTTTIN